MERTGILPVESKQELWVSHDGNWSFRRAKGEGAKAGASAELWGAGQAKEWNMVSLSKVFTKRQNSYYPCPPYPYQRPIRTNRPINPF